LTDRVGFEDPRVTIVMYHYVRSAAASRFPRLPALDVAAFRGQLDYIQRHYSPISSNDLIEAARGTTMLPARAILLTFDDGYADHFSEVFPLLRERGISGMFFPVTMSLIERRVLDVNKIQFVLAAAGDPEPIARDIDETVERLRKRNDIRSVDEYRADGLKAIRYDTPEASYVKYMLQRALPEDVRSVLVEDLFARLVSADERAFGDALYLTVDQAREMAANGMTIGCHADRHVMLTTLTRDGQAREIDGALRVLDAVNLPRTSFAYSYAKGAHDADSIDLLRARGCALAVTNVPDVAVVSPDTMLSLPRLDANHLPTDGRAAPNEWSHRA